VRQCFSSALPRFPDKHAAKLNEVRLRTSVCAQSP
jgi:hypothetical protein